MNRRQQRGTQAGARRNRALLYWLAGAIVLVVAVVLAVVLSGKPASTQTASVQSAATLQRIPPQEAFDALQAGEAVLYDVRIADAYSAEHAEGAISLPESEAIARIGELPGDRLLIFY
jgi:hypothetical protein